MAFLLHILNFSNFHWLKRTSTDNHHSQSKPITYQIPWPKQNILCIFLLWIIIYFLQGLESIPCKEIGYILRTLGQNPTEDEILEIVCEAGCDWEGDLTKEDFLKVSQAKIQSQVNRLDDVKAAFRFVINIVIIRWISDWNQNQNKISY